MQVASGPGRHLDLRLGKCGSLVTSRHAACQAHCQQQLFLAYFVPAYIISISKSLLHVRLGHSVQHVH